MSISITASPQYPVPNRPVKLLFTATTGTIARLYVTAAPLDSKYRKQLDESAADAVHIGENEIGTPFEFFPDVAGAFTLEAQEIETPPHGPSFKGDDRGFIVVAETGGGDPIRGTEKMLSSSSLPLHVGQRLTAPIGLGADTATLVLFTWGDYIRATTTAVHGELTPRIEKPSSPIAKTAANSTTVRTALAALTPSTPITATQAAGDPPADLDTMIERMDVHFANDTVHIAADTTNGVDNAYKTSGSKAAFPKSLAKAIERLNYHMTTDATVDGTDFGPGTGEWHAHGGVGVVSDNINLIRATAPTDMTSAAVAFAEFCRCYGAHIENTNVHAVADSSAPLPTLAALVDLHAAFLSVTAANNPTAPAEENAGATYLIHQLGMKAG